MIDAITGLRGIAVMLVLAVHTMPGYFPGGFIGVDVFFVISGFLITTTALRDLEHRRFTLANFFKRRAVRILPPLLLTLVVSTVIAIIIGMDATTLKRGVISSLLFATNWARIVYDHPLGLFGHLWSIAIEEQFYLAYPIVLVLLARWRRLERLRSLLLLTLGVMWLGKLHHWMNGFDYWTVYHATHLRPTGLVFGCLAAIFSRDGKIDLPTGNILPVFFLCLLAAVTVMAKSEWVLTNLLIIDLVCLTTALVMIQLTTGRKTKPLPIFENPVLRAVGQISYSLYLSHLPVWYLYFHIKTGLFGIPLLDYQLFWAILLVIPLMLAVAAVFYRISEKPFLDMRSRLRQTPAISAAA